MNIILANPNYLAREGFKYIINGNSSLKVAGEITKRIDIWPQVETQKPDVLVMDYTIPNFIDIEELEKINEISEKTKMLVISDDRNKGNILKAIKYGVTGYLSKQCEKEEIINALFTIHKGEKFFCNKILDVILEKENNQSIGPSALNLSEREIEVITLVASGYSNKEIADKLFISIHTLYTHRKNIMKKLNFKSPVELVLFALDLGLIDTKKVESISKEIIKS